MINSSLHQNIIAAEGGWIVTQNHYTHILTTQSDFETSVIANHQTIKITLITDDYENPPSEHVIVLFTLRFL